jgi:acetylornithine deacetylase/succinyl-diaminopimelate desuccinylase-like protein
MNKLDRFPKKTQEILEVSQELIKIPSVTACPSERLDEVRKAHQWIKDYLTNAGLLVYSFEGKYPSNVGRVPSFGREEEICASNVIRSF